MGQQQKDFNQKQQQPQAGQQQGEGRKNNEEVGEPIQLDEKTSKQGQQDKPGMGQREEHGGQHQGGQQGGQRQGGGTANR